MPRGPKPKPAEQKVSRVPLTHEFKEAQPGGWQHGEVPEPPPNLTDAGKAAWSTWFSGWWAAFWKLEDVPGLQLTVLTFDRVHRGDLDVSKAVPLLDRYGITPKGRQDLRWNPPKEAPAEPESVSSGARLRVVDAS